MSKPWMKFYPADWQADPAVRSCSLMARGLWVEMLCLMQKSEPIGHLLVNGNAPKGMGLATLCGASKAQVEKGLAELERAGVFSRTESGVIYSRRMIRDEQRVAEAQRNGAKGGNPSLKPGVGSGVNPLDKAGVGEGVKAQSPESRIQKESNARQARLPDALVNQIWESAPAKARERSSKADVRRTMTAAIKRGADPDTVAASLLAYYRSEDASKDDGAFAKGIHRMIEGDRWKDWSPAAAVSAKPAEIDWPARLEGWTRERFWIPTMWGADPSSDLCRAPIELLTPEVRRPRMGAR